MQTELSDKLFRFCEDKKRVLEFMYLAGKQAIERLSLNYKEIRRHVIIDGVYNNYHKPDFLKNLLLKLQNLNNNNLTNAVETLAQSHRIFFGEKSHQSLEIRFAGDASFLEYGEFLSFSRGNKEILSKSGNKVQAFQTIFETGKNTHGHVHKLEAHEKCTEFVYAFTDKVFGVLLPDQLKEENQKIIADPREIKLFYVPEGNFVSIHPLVFHTGSLSVEEDKNFSVMIYKQPNDANNTSIYLPENWNAMKERIRFGTIDKFFLTFPELHAQRELEKNIGFIYEKIPRLNIY